MEPDAQFSTQIQQFVQDSFRTMIGRLDTNSMTSSGQTAAQTPLASHKS
jgi:hypothetical protein